VHTSAHGRQHASMLPAHTNPSTLALTCSLGCHDARCTSVARILRRTFEGVARRQERELLLELSEPGRGQLKVLQRAPCSDTPCSIRASNVHHQHRATWCVGATTSEHGLPTGRQSAYLFEVLPFYRRVWHSPFGLGHCARKCALRRARAKALVRSVCEAELRTVQTF
jgi:hypothetical protein